MDPMEGGSCDGWMASTSSDLRGEIIGADNSREDLLPSKSKILYESTYVKYVEWKREHRTNSNSESIILAYFDTLKNKYKPSTLWSIYSMLGRTLQIRDRVNIADYSELKAFMKKQSAGFKSKKFNVLLPQDVDRFLAEAPDKEYLATKVALIFGMSGACRSRELVTVRVQDITRQGNLLVVNVPDTKTKKPRTFVIAERFSEIVQKYWDLRPAHATTDRFFLNFQKNKCTNQAIGIHKFSKMPKDVASYLKLKNAESYTGHAFRRTNATLLADGGANIAGSKRNGRKNSSDVAESCVEKSMYNGAKIGSVVSSSANFDGPSTSKRAAEDSAEKFQYESAVGDVEVFRCTEVENGDAASSADSDPLYFESVDLNNGPMKTEVTDSDSIDGVDVSAVRHVPPMEESLDAANMANNESPVDDVDVSVRIKVEDDGAAANIDSEQFYFESVDLSNGAIKMEVNGSNPVDVVDLTAVCHPTSMKRSLDATNMANNESPVDNVDVSRCINVEDDDAALTINSEPFIVSSIVTISKRMGNDSTSTVRKYSTAVPSPWSVTEQRTDEGKALLFSYAVMKKSDSGNIPVMQRCVVLNADRTLQYFVHGYPVRTRETRLNDTLNNAELLSSTLQAFQRMVICSGIGIPKIIVPIENGYQDGVQQWRHRDCTLVSTRKICDRCARLRIRVNQPNTASRPMLKPIHRTSFNPSDQQKIAALLKKNNRERRKKLAAQKRRRTKF